MVPDFTSSYLLEVKPKTPNAAQKNSFVGFRGLAVALIYAAFLSLSVSSEFKDFGNYLIYADNSGDFIASWQQVGTIALLSNEPLWLFFNDFLRSILGTEEVVRFIIFVSALSFALLIQRQNGINIFWLLIILFFPLIIKNFLIHIRQGLAIAVFLWGWSSQNQKFRWLCFGASPFIHSSFFVVLALYGFAKFARRLPFDSVIRTIFLFTACFAMTVFLETVARFLGARQVFERDVSSFTISGMGFIFWLYIFMIFLKSGERFIQNNLFAVAVFIYYLQSYWILDFSSRIFESGLVVLLIAIASMPDQNKRVAQISIFVFSVLLWVMRWNAPLVGFGVE